jgi:hypothetical protein
MTVAIQTVAREVLRGRAAAGAEWFDVEYPGWANRVDLDLLNMRFPRMCVAGQVSGLMFTEFLTVHKFSGPDECDDSCTRLGLNADTIEEFDFLNEAWKEEILGRRQSTTEKP